LRSIFVGVAVPVYLVDGLPAPHWLIGPLLAANTAPPAHRGRYLAVYQYAFAFANILAPTFFTALYTRGRVLPWLTLAVLATAATVTMYALDGPLKTRENVTV
jgi:hypothetical protein